MPCFAAESIVPATAPVAAAEAINGPVLFFSFVLLITDFLCG